jgi:hypothetical protein
VTLINAKLITLNDKKCINLHLKDAKNQFKYASIWNIDNCLPLIQTTQFESITKLLKKYYNNILSFNISKKEIKKNGKDNIYFNIKNIDLN